VLVLSKKEKEMVTNIIACPKCETTFEYNKVNGLAQVEVAQSIESRKRMYLKLTLDALERLYRENNPTFGVVKKIILDNVNDYTRDIHTILGFGEDAE
jgi:hypothetical protein